MTTVFETETMAELCVKQGLVSEALTIYRRLVANAPRDENGGNDETRARLAARLSALERIAKGVVDARGAAAPVDQGASTVTLDRRGDALRFSWSLPAETSSPALQVLLVRRGAGGIEAETRTIPLDGPTGSTSLVVPNLYSLRAAAGWLDGARFVPLARLPDGGS
jgi:hypothetical protein